MSSKDEILRNLAKSGWGVSKHFTFKGFRLAAAQRIGETEVTVSAVDWDDQKSAERVARMCQRIGRLK